MLGSFPLGVELLLSCGEKKKRGEKRLKNGGEEDGRWKGGGRAEQRKRETGRRRRVTHLEGGNFRTEKIRGSAVHLHLLL